MAKLPPAPPAAELARRCPADPVVVTRATLLLRIYAAASAHAGGWDGFRTFGPVATARFDPHVPPPREQDRGVLYLGLSLQTCVAEVFQDGRLIDRRRRAPWLVAFHLTREVRLLDLAGRWPTRAGASQAISSGPRSRAQGWARAIYEAYPDIEGVWYRSAMNGGEPAVALWERAADALPAEPEVHLPLSHPGLEVPLGRISDRIGYLLT